MSQSILGTGLTSSRESMRVLKRAATLLRQIERGARLNHRLLRRFVSSASGLRFPGAARVAPRHKALLGASVGAWTQATMHGPSAWSIGERELMAAMVAKWNACAFCTEMRAAAAARYLGRASVDATLADYHAAPISEGLKTTLAFLEIMTQRPKQLTEERANAVFASGISIETLIDAIEIGVMFNLISRYANALDFAIPAATGLPGRLTRRPRADSVLDLPAP